MKMNKNTTKQNKKKKEYRRSHGQQQKGEGIRKEGFTKKKHEK